MRNKDKSAFGVTLKDNNNPNHSECKGLTKREYFVGLIIQGICSNTYSTVSDADISNAIKITDELLKQLEDEN